MVLRHSACVNTFTFNSRLNPKGMLSFMRRWLSAIFFRDQIYHDNILNPSYADKALNRAPEALETLGRRSLTRPLSPSPPSKFNSTNKNYSPHPLLDVLPLEIRLHIWTDVLRGHNFHLEIQAGRLRGLCCISPGSIYLQSYSWWL